MNNSGLNIDTQLSSASEWAAECERSRVELNQIQSEMLHLVEGRDRELINIREMSERKLTQELSRIRQNAEGMQETVRLDSRYQHESLRESYSRNSRQLAAFLAAAVEKLEEQRKSETWILQSVLDEDVEDSPVMQFEREAETYVTQKAFLDERFEQLQQQLKHTQTFLEACHAGTDVELPVSNLETRNRSALRDAAVEAGDIAFAEGAEIEKMHLPHWVKGFRVWGFSLLCFILLWVPIVSVKADLQQFVNPEFNRPNWQWAAVAAVIAAAVVLLGALVLLLTVQGRLRTRFQRILQNVSNAEHARKAWEQKSEKQIDRLEQSADEWRHSLAERRSLQTQKIQTEIDGRIQFLQTQNANQVNQFAQDFSARTQLYETDSVNALTRISTQQEHDLQTVRLRFAQELSVALQKCEQYFQTATTQQRDKAHELLQSWNGSVERLRNLSQTSISVAAPTLRWPVAEKWALPAEMPQSISLGDILVTAPKAPESLESATSTSQCVEMPAILRFPADISILVEHDSAGRDVALSFIRTQLLKLLTVIPAGRIRLTLIDPIGLGQSFSAMMHLADFDELLIQNRIWTDGSQIRDQLQKVTEHMENIFQTYLRSQFDSIEEYNISAGEVAEPYHFVVVAGFPTAFTEESARHLSSILTSGSRCGVHALVAWNPAIAAPPSFDVDDLKNNCMRFFVTGDVVQPRREFPSSVLFEPFAEPVASQYVKLVRAVGEQSRDARRVEVSFNRIAPRPDEIWSHSSADGIDLPIGRAGAARLQFMRLGRGTSQHVLIAGKTGSGKSTFLHILITNLALHYSPEEIQFYLIDFKKGVEFRTYAAHRLPHARVVAIESDREFGLSVLERLDEVLQERGELFRDRGVQDVPSFRERFPAESMPRLLLLIDEFQEFFTAEDRVSARASLLLDRLVRQGRAFGIHILLGSQTLGGAYSLARSTMGQIAVRIALQCSESDAHLILSEDNMAARLLTRPGEAIYNDANGLVQGNHQFQVAWLDEARREEGIRTMLKRTRSDSMVDYRMIVFEGNVAPTAELCAPLNSYLARRDDATRRAADAVTIWLGEPIAIAAPTFIELRRASGQNILIVGQDEGQVDSLLAFTMLSTCCGSKGGEDVARLTMLHDGRDRDSLQRFVALRDQLHQPSLEILEATQCEATVETLYQQVVAREENAELSAGPEHILIVRNIGQFRAIRKDEDDYGLGSFGEPKKLTLASMFSDILKRGPLVGIHVVVWSDTFNNAVRWFSNSLLREFENRIAFRMNQTDSASLVDNPVAASLGQGRALVYRDQTGTTEKFRPFAWPSSQWLAGLVTAAGVGEANDFDIDSLTIE